MKRRIIRIVLLLVVIALVMLVTSGYFINTEKHSKVENIKENSVVIVLGAGL